MSPMTDRHDEAIRRLQAAARRLGFRWDWATPRGPVAGLACWRKAEALRAERERQADAARAESNTEWNRALDAGIDPGLG